MRTTPHLWYQTDMNITEILSLHFKLELSEGLNERHALYVSDRTAQLQKDRQNFRHQKPVKLKPPISQTKLKIVLD